MMMIIMQEWGCNPEETNQWPKAVSEIDDEYETKRKDIKGIDDYKLTIKVWLLANPEIPSSGAF